MDNNFDLDKKNENTRNGFGNEGNTYSEYQPPQTKDEFRINAAIQPKTFNKIVIGLVAASTIGGIILVIKLISWLTNLF